MDNTRYTRTISDTVSGHLGTLSTIPAWYQTQDNKVTLPILSVPKLQGEVYRFIGPMCHAAVSLYEHAIHAFNFCTCEHAILLLYMHLGPVAYIMLLSVLLPTVVFGNIVQRQPLSDRHQLADTPRNKCNAKPQLHCCVVKFKPWRSAAVARRLHFGGKDLGISTGEAAFGGASKGTILGIKFCFVLFCHTSVSSVQNKTPKPDGQVIRARPHCEQCAVKTERSRPVVTVEPMLCSKSNTLVDLWPSKIAETARLWPG